MVVEASWLAIVFWLEKLGHRLGLIPGWSQWHAQNCSCNSDTNHCNFSFSKLTYSPSRYTWVMLHPQLLMRSQSFSISLIWATSKSKFLSALFLVISTRMRVASSSALRILTAHPFDCLVSDCSTYFSGFLYAASLCASIPLNCINRI